MKGDSCTTLIEKFPNLTSFELSDVVLPERSLRILQLRQQISFNSKTNLRGIKSPQLQGTWVYVFSRNSFLLSFLKRFIPGNFLPGFLNGKLSERRS